MAKPTAKRTRSDRRGQSSSPTRIGDDEFVRSFATLMSQLGEQAQRLFPHGVASLDFSVTEGGGFNTRVLAAGEGATRVFEARVASFDIAADDAVPDYLQIGSDDTIPEDAEPTERSGFDIAASAAAPMIVEAALRRVVIVPTSSSNNARP